MAHKSLQAPITEYSGVTIGISTHDEKQWQLLLWEYDSADTELRFDFDTIDAACEFANREFQLTSDDWMQCEWCGSPLAIVDVVRHLYRRRLTRAEAAAVAYLAYNYQCLDERGLFIWPGHGRYTTTFRVIAYDVLDTVDWDHGYEFSSVSYDFVAHAVIGDLDDTPEFRELWEAFRKTARVSRWRTFEPQRRLPEVTISGTGPLAELARLASHEREWQNWQSGYVARAIGLRENARLIPVRRIGHGSSTFEVAALDEDIHIILTSRTGDATDFFLTSTDGAFLGAARRADDTAAVETLAVRDARQRFEQQIEQWLTWLNESGAESRN